MALASASERGFPAAAIPFVDLGRQHLSLADDLRAAFDRVLGRSAFVLGEEVEAFEREFASYVGCEDCIGVSSGTAALSIALRAAGIGPGDEVIVPGHTFIATALGVLHAGATPVLCDVDAGTSLLDPAAARAAVGPRTAAIIAVHLYGQACDMDALKELAGTRGLALFEDAAQAHGATWQRRPAGSFGVAGCFSFYPSKNLGALGDGGAICTSDTALAQRARQLRNLGQRQKGEHVELGFNERLDGLQAAMLRVKLPHLDRSNQMRRAHARRYRAGLPEELRVVTERPESPSVHHVFAVRTSDRDRLRTTLSRDGIQTGIHYTPALRDHPAIRDVIVVADDLVQSGYWAAEQVSLPMFAELEDSELDRVAAACVRAVG